MASLEPLWVKIADFGVSKRVKNTAARTQIFSSGYTAPEMLGLVPPKFIEQGLTAFALDIWSLGALVHELLTSETPFLQPELDHLEVDPETGLSELLPERRIDYASLGNYCVGEIDFPTQVLDRVHQGNGAITFVKSLLIANPKDRPSATCALQHPWLAGPGSTYTNGYVEKLRSEFSCLGVDMDFVNRENILARQVGKEDIMRFLPGSSKAQIPSLALGAVVNGCNLALARLFRSPDCDLDLLTRGKLFQQAAENRQPETLEILVEHKVYTRARIGDKTILNWAIESGHISIVNLLLGSMNGDSELLITW